MSLPEFVHAVAAADRHAIPRPSRIAVLMGTFNGSRFLGEQLASIEAQDLQHIDIWASDDGSTDETLGMLQDWQQRWTKGRLNTLSGPRAGFAENYRALICNADIDADYYAFSDQDDIWEPQKLSTAMAWFQTKPDNRPLLFGSRTSTMSGTGHIRGGSPRFQRPPSFRNALVQSIAGANTMVMNRTARHILAEASARTGFVSHDWWAYLVLSGAGGDVCFSPEPLVRYRQHGGNAVGQNVSVCARLDRLRRLMAGQFFDWTTANIRGLSLNCDLLTADAWEAFDLFRSSREGGMITRLRRLRASGVYRQTAIGTAAIALATAFRRL